MQEMFYHRHKNTLIIHICRFGSRPSKFIVDWRSWSITVPSASRNSLVKLHCKLSHVAMGHMCLWRWEEFSIKLSCDCCKNENLACLSEVCVELMNQPLCLIVAPRQSTCVLLAWWKYQPSTLNEARLRGELPQQWSSMNQIHIQLREFKLPFLTGQKQTKCICSR